MRCSEAGIVMAHGQAGCEQAEDQEGLCAGLVLDVVLDGIRDEVLVLEEHLQEHNTAHQ